MKERLNPVVIGLTATPPYDVTAAEWQRYMELNGPVDTEVSVPELMLEGDLCPHQDFVYFTHPTEQENKSIVDFRDNIQKVFGEIKKDEILVQAMENHPVWLFPMDHLDWVYTNISFYSACLIFLHSNGKEIPATHLEILGHKKIEIPDFDYEWAETLLDFYLYQDKDGFKRFEKHRQSLENRLKRYGAIERRKICLSHNKRITGVLSSSISKLNGIKEIVDFEYGRMAHQLRLVVLCDYIRKEYMSSERSNDLELDKTGVVPVFETLRRENKNGKKIGMLTGSLVLIPSESFSEFEKKAAEHGIFHINAENVSYDDRYTMIPQAEQLRNHLVHIVTQLFQEGEIEVLIGTKSLLGEGWDAPAINTLILASFVGSFVLSNQMRGRAIRTQKNNPGKTGNIWHLACIEPGSPTGGDDLDLLRRRFRTFVGVSLNDEPVIENGTGRLNLPDDLHLKAEAENKNIEMFAWAGDRGNLRQRWEDALEKGMHLVEEIKIPLPGKKDYGKIKSLYLRKTIANLAIAVASGWLSFGFESLQGISRAARNIRSFEDLYVFFAIFGAVGVAVFGRLTFKTFSLFIRYRDISKDVKGIGNALLQSMVHAGTIQSDDSGLKVVTSVDRWGAVYCHLEGGTTYEKSLFIQSLQEVVSPVINPRYIIIRKSRFLFFIKQKDFHSVPEILGRNKKSAEDFRNEWKKSVGSCDLVFTRTVEGRKLILQSRMKSLASRLDEEVEHVSKWR